jgi:hypothetical protein
MVYGPRSYLRVTAYVCCSPPGVYTRHLTGSGFVLPLSGVLLRRRLRQTSRAQLPPGYAW